MSDTLQLLDGLSIESRTRKLCCQVFRKNQQSFYKLLSLTGQNQLSVTCQTIRQLKQKLQHHGVAVHVEVSSEQASTKRIFYDWELYACILWNKLLAVMNMVDQKTILLVEISVIDLEAELSQSKQ